MGFVIFFIFVILYLKDFKYGVICTAFTMQFLSYLGVGIPGVKIYVVLVLLTVVFFVTRYSKFVRGEKYPLPLKIATLIFLLSYAISEFNAGLGHISTVFSNFLTAFFFPIALWYSLDSKDRVKQALRILIVIMSIAYVYGIIEQILRVNYFTLFVNQLFAIEDFMIDASTVRYGLKRCNSIFSYFSTFGVFSVMSFVVFFMMKFVYQYKEKWILYLVLLSAFSAFSTGSRAIFLGLFLCCFVVLLNKKIVKTKTFFRIVLLVLLVLPLFLGVAFQVYDSMVNSDTSKYADGSSSELRELQWAVCEPYFLSSFWVGNGRMYIWEVVQPAHPILQGAESIWFSILVDYGVLGAFAFVSLLLMVGVVLYKVDKRLVCVPIAYLLILSLSPDCGIQYNILLTFCILLVKMNRYLSLQIRV